VHLQADRALQGTAAYLEVSNHKEERTRAGDERKHKGASAAPGTCCLLDESSPQGLQMVWGKWKGPQKVATKAAK